MTTLFDIAGIQARIFHLPSRPPFMLAADLADVYGTNPKRINEAVKRNPRRFPADFAFELTVEETALLKSQNATSNRANRALLTGFTHGGANALSGVLKTPVADAMSVEVHRAFAEMEQKAVAEVKAMVLKLRTDASRKPIYMWIKTYVEKGRSLEELWRATNYSRPRLEQAAREMLAQGLIPQLPAGMQPGLFDA